MKISANGSYQSNTTPGGYKVFEFEDEAGFAKIVKNSDHCTSLLKDGYRSGTNFISSDFLYGDIDGGMSIEEFQNHPDFRDCFYILATSKSHGIPKKDKPACDRFHVFLPVQTITDQEELRSKLVALNKAYPFLDPCAKDCVRLLHAFKGSKVIWHDGKEFKLPVVKDVFEDDIPYDDNPPAVRVPANTQKYNGKFIDDKKTAVLKKLKECADAGMFDLDCDWSKLGMALYAEGYTEQDWTALSKPGVNENDTAKRWKSFEGVREVTGATLFYFCRQLDDGFMRKSERPATVSIAPKKPLEKIRPEDLPSIDIAMPLELWREDHCVIKYEKGDDDEQTDKIKEFKVKPTIEQFEIMLNYYGIEIQENLMIHKVECIVPGVTNGGKSENSAVGRIKTLCVLNNIPVANSAFDSYLATLAHQNKYHPVKDWLDGLQWDGESRLETLYNTVEEAPGYSKTFKATLIRKWFLSCVAAIYEDQYTGRGVLTIQGRQGIGKTTWLRSFFPKSLKCFKDGLTLDPRSKDSISIAISNWVCELGELEGTFKRADIAALKAFITMPADTIRMPYERREETYERRTIFAASVNSMIFLGDQTGTSRFWAVQAVSLDYEHDIDIEQLWAELCHIYHSSKADGDKAIWWLSDSEEDMLADLNQAHTEMDEFDEIFHTAFQPIEDGCPNHWSYTEALKKAGYDHPTRFQINKFRDVVLKSGLKKSRVKGKDGHYFPDTISEWSERSNGGGRY